jgi:hypothetical protein
MQPLNKATEKTLSRIKSRAAASADGWCRSVDFDVLHLARLTRRKLIESNRFDLSLIRPV